MTQVILAVQNGGHDTAAAVFVDYELKAAVQLERLTRLKSDSGWPYPKIPEPAIAEVLGIFGASIRDVDVFALGRANFDVRFFRPSASRLPVEFFRTYVQHKLQRRIGTEVLREGNIHFENFFDIKRLKHDLGLRDDVTVAFYNHHLSHALPTLFYTDWDNALLVTADGGGDTVNYSHRQFRDGELKTIYGGEECYLTPYPADSLAKAYAAATASLGFRPHRHEGKLTGLSAFGNPIFADEIAKHFRVNGQGRVTSDFWDGRGIIGLMRKIAGKGRREDVAASIQKVVEDVMLVSVRNLLANNPARRLGLAGGLFANVRLNRVLAENLDIDELFVFPPMGDEGLPIGGALEHLLRRDGMERWLAQRRRLEDVYWGRDYTAAADAWLSSLDGVRQAAGDPVATAAKRLALGEIGAIYTGRMEFGPRALGARSILANPSRRETHDLLNQRLSRTEFMPFAPVIQAERAAEVFEVSPLNRYACRFMTITCNVRPHWRDRIAAVVHVDGSARPQIVERDTNPLYYDVITAFERETGIPVLVNTSFNVHEEPIVNTPRECAKALIDRRIDFVLTNKAVYSMA